MRGARGKRTSATCYYSAFYFSLQGLSFYLQSDLCVSLMCSNDSRSGSAAAVLSYGALLDDYSPRWIKTWRELKMRPKQSYLI